jgi:8-oxo-dGTP diphosphatase
MAARAQEDASWRRTCPLLLIFFFVFLVIIIIVYEIAIFPGLVFVFLIVFFVRVIGDEVQVDGMGLRNLKFGFALGTTQDFAFFDFVFIDIDFGGTFRATDHGSTLRIVVCKVGVRGPRPPPCSVLYTAVYEFNSCAWWHCFECHHIIGRRTLRMTSSREYPERPVVGIGGVIIDQGRALLIRRGSEPLRGEWSIPGGALEIGESLEEGVARELLEETGIEVRVLELIEVFDRIYLEPTSTGAETKRRPRFHFVIVDYLCERLGGEPRAGSDVTEVAFARQDELMRFRLTDTATRVLKKAFAMDRARQAAK